MDPSVHDYERQYEQAGDAWLALSRKLDADIAHYFRRGRRLSDAEWRQYLADKAEKARLHGLSHALHVEYVMADLQHDNAVLQAEVARLRELHRTMCAPQHRQN
jgi:hypothetical protein